jgi:hypothetical protein
MPLGFGRSPRLGLALATALAACFSEAPTESGTNGTTGGTCPLGSLGCPCDGEQCNEDLACEPSISRCIDPSCTPGHLLCTCSEGACLMGLACIDGLCDSPGGDTDPPLTSGPTTAMTTTLTDSAGTQSDPTGATGPDDTGAPPGTTGDERGCRMLACDACRECEVVPEGDCNIAWEQCQVDPACAPLANCTIDCAEGDDVCVSACCEMHGDGSNVQYNGGVANCLEMACPDCPSMLRCPAG